MTTRIRRISGKGCLYDGETRLLAVAYIILLHEQAVIDHDGKTRLRTSDFSITVGSSPDYDIYPYIGRRVALRLQDGKLITGAIVSLSGTFLTSRGSLPDEAFREIAER